MRMHSFMAVRGRAYATTAAMVRRTAVTRKRVPMVSAKTAAIGVIRMGLSIMPMFCETVPKLMEMDVLAGWVLEGAME